MTTTPTPVERAAEAIDDWTGVGHASVAIAEAVLAAALSDVEGIATAVCDATEGWEHSDQSDDHPCSRCKQQARALIEHLTGATR